MLMTYKLYGRCMWHEDCDASFTGQGVMKLVERREEHDLMECLHCGRRGYYPVGAVG